MKNQLQLAIALFFGLLSFQSNAQTSNLSIQGILRTAEGLAVENGDYNITFKLYATPYVGEPGKNLLIMFPSKEVFIVQF